MKKRHKKISEFGDRLNIPTKISHIEIEKQKQRIRELFNSFELCKADEIAEHVLEDLKDSDNADRFSKWYEKESKKAEKKLEKKYIKLFTAIPYKIKIRDGSFKLAGYELH